MKSLCLYLEELILITAEPSPESVLSCLVWWWSECYCLAVGEGRGRYGERNRNEEVGSLYAHSQ